MSTETARHSKGTRSGLPAAWRLVRLGDVGAIQSGITLGRRLPEVETRPVPYLRVANVMDGTLDLATIYSIDATEVEIEKRRLMYGDLLLTEGGDPDKLGRGTFWEEQLPECVHQNHIFRARFDPTTFSPQFISAQIGSPYGKAYFLAHAKRTTGIATINQKVLSNFPLMVPPLAEQEKIAAGLSERMAAVDKAREAAQAELGAAMGLPAAIVRETLAASGTRRQVLGDCLVEVRAGVGPSWSRYPVLGATRDGLAPAKEPVGKAPERYKFVDPVTVFYNPMRILLGSIALVDEVDEAGITSPDYVVVKGRPGVLDTRWFYHWFRSAPGAQLIDSLSRGAVRERILFNRLAAGAIHLPDYDAQLQASRRMRMVRPVVEGITRELETIERLPSAILREAFPGAA